MDMDPKYMKIEILESKRPDMKNVLLTPRLEIFY